MARQIWKMEPTDRWIRGTVNGETVVDSKHARLMIESPGEVDYYFPLEDVRVDLLEDVEQAYLTPTDTHSVCPYKGTASYYSVTVNGETYKDIIWAYPEPIPEAPRLKGTISFWPEKDKRIQIFVDGEKV